MQFSCAYTETQGVYGTVSVNNSLVASHDPATADANHAFSLLNGMLKVEIPNSAGNGTDYRLADGVLSVNPGFTGTLTAEYEFTTSPTREIDFEYDHNGLRTQKKVVENGITTIYDYTLHGKLITHLTKRVVDLDGIESSEELHFFYDAQSRPAFVEYDGTKYRYIHNLQGDIVAIVDAAGNRVVEYKYDAWGKDLYESDRTLGILNLFRYRGYVWDSEMGFYYLRDRYYCVESRRFINADQILGLKGESLSHNVFGYCSNNPILYEDHSGALFGISIFVGAAVAIAGAIIGAATQMAVNIATGEDLGKGVLGAAVGGAVYNAVSVYSYGNTALAGYASAAAESVTNEVVGYIVGEKELSTDNIYDSMDTVATDTLVNGTAYMITGKLSDAASPVTKSMNRANRKTKVKNVLSSKWGQEIVKQTLAQTCYNYQYLFYSQMK